VKWSRGLLFKFFDTLHISRTVKLETLNLACRLDTEGPNEQMQNSVKRGYEGVTRPTFGHFGIPSISRERLKVETSNLAHKLATGEAKRYTAKLGQMGSWWGHVTYF